MIHVLIVEDDPMVAKFNRVFLEKVSGFTVAGEVHDTSAAWTFLENNDVDLILLDIYMANTNGLDMLVELRNLDMTVDVIVITAANDYPSIQRALHYGAVDYLIKSFNFERFKKALLKSQKNSDLINGRKSIQQVLHNGSVYYLIKPFNFERFKKALLKYRQKSDLMNGGKGVRQEELDVFLLNDHPQDVNPLDLPKGLTTLTLGRIARQIINWEQDAFSAAEIADVTGISRVSITKYLKYLVSLHSLKVEASYQLTGPPLHRYHLNPESMNMIYTFVADE